MADDKPTAFDESCSLNVTGNKTLNSHPPERRYCSSGICFNIGKKYVIDGKQVYLCEKHSKVEVSDGTTGI